MNQQLLRKIERMQVVRDHELFSLSSDEEESYWKIDICCRIIFHEESRIENMIESQVEGWDYN